jgi:drug/metabolite transporter (DMT)-like permease
VAIRHSVSGKLSIAATIAPLASSGVIFPALIALQQFGIKGLAAIPLKTHLTMLGAGTFNAIGFFAVAAAMARLPLTRVNLINASQAALCALAGIAWFHEPATTWVAAGTLLTIISLAILGSQRTTTTPDASLILDADQPTAGQDPVKEIASLATDG